MSDEQGKTQEQMIDELIAGLGSSEETDIKSPETETEPDETVDGAEPVSEEIEAGEEFEEEEEIEERVVAEAEPEPEGEVETEEAIAEEEIDELAELRKQNRLLQERVEALSTVTHPVSTEVPESVTTATDSPLVFLLEGESVDDILDDPKKFNEFAMRIYSRAKEDARTGVLRSIPNIIIHQVQQQRVLNDAIEEFYKENEDLKPVRRTVGVVTNEVVSEHPDWALDKVLDEVAKKTRQVLGMKQRVESRIKKRVRKPALVKKKTTSSAKPASPNISELERDILDTIL